MAKLEKLTSAPKEIEELSENEREQQENTELQTKILWVDDYPSNNAFIVDLFQRQGINVDISLSTDDAMKKIKNKRYDAVISDLGRMENGRDNSMAGLDLLRLIKKSEIKIPTLIFAGRRGLAHVNELTEAGAADVTASGTEVISFIQRVIGR